MRRFSILPALVFVLACVLATSAAADEFKGKVVGVTDGDTIAVLQDKTEVKVRLSGIDCPEMGQPYGERAKQFTSALCFGDEVTVRSPGKDKYGRTLGDVALSDGRVLNQEILKAGFAWWYKEFSNDEALQKLESEAKEKKRGLWSDPAPIAPWEWRHRNVPADISQLPKEDKKPAVKQQIVYITKTGTKYHADGCKFLSKSKIAIALDDAVEKGYTPCSVCSPPKPSNATAPKEVKPEDTAKAAEVAKPVDVPAASSSKTDNSEETVYVTRTGSKYHRAGCRSLSKSQMPMKLADAVKRYSPCSICNPPRLVEKKAD